MTVHKICAAICAFAVLMSPSLAQKKYGEPMIFCSEYKSALELLVALDTDIDELRNYKYRISNVISSLFIDGSDTKKRFKQHRQLLLNQFLAYSVRDDAEMRSSVREWRRRLDPDRGPSELHAFTRDISARLLGWTYIKYPECKSAYPDEPPNTACVEKCLKDREIGDLFRTMGAPVNRR